MILGRHHCSRLLPLGNGFSALFARQNNARLAAVCFIPNRKRCGIVLPLSQKSHSAFARCDFREPCQTGLSYYRTGENSPSSPAPPARCKGQKQKAWFLLLQKLSFVQPRAGKQFRVIFQSRALHSTPVYSRKSRAKALRFAVILGRHHCSRLLPLGNGFSALFALFQDFLIIKRAKIHPLPLHRPRGARGKSKKRGFCFCKNYLLFSPVRASSFA